MNRKRWWLWLAALPLASGAAMLPFTSACEVTPDEPARDRQPVLRDLTANVILPTYEKLASDTAALSSSTSALRAQVNADTLKATQALYRTARATQKTSEAFLFGPADDITVTGETIDTWPANGGKLDELLQGSAAIDAAAIAGLGANVRGLAALEYLLFDSAVSDAEVLARFSDARRAQLTESLALDLANKCKLLRDAFVGPEGFGAQLTQAGLGSTKFPQQSQGIDEIVTGMLQGSELMVTRKLAKPLGSDNNSVAQPQLEEGPRSDSSLTDLKANLDGIEAIYTGAQAGRVGLGIGSAVREVNAGVDMRFTQTLADVRNALNAVTPSYRVALVQNRAQLQAVYDAARALKTGIQTELAGALGASLGFGFSDTD